MYLAKAQTWLGLRFMPFPGPRSSSDQVRGECTVPGGLCILITSLVPASQFPGYTVKAPLMCAFCLFWGADLRLQPSWQMSTFQEPRNFVSNWKPAHNLVEDAISGAEIAPHFLALAVACQPIFLWQEDGPVHSQLAFLWYLLSPLFWE